MDTKLKCRKCGREVSAKEAGSRTEKGVRCRDCTRRMLRTAESAGWLLKT